MKLDDLLNSNIQFNKLLSGMPDNIKVRCIIKKFPVGSTIIKKDSNVKYVYVLVEGKVRIINEFENGNIYAFACNTSLNFMGELEVLGGKTKQAATNEALTECIVLQMTAGDFLNWMEADHSALIFVAKLLADKMYPTSRENGNILFKSGIIKAQTYLKKHYMEKSKNGEIIQINKKRQQIADEIGMSVKTVNRSIKKLKDDGLISIKKGKIYINKDQYAKLLLAIKKSEN